MNIVFASKLLNFWEKYGFFGDFPGNYDTFIIERDRWWVGMVVRWWVGKIGAWVVKS